MKYLSNRSEYLKSAKYEVSINESMAGAGPFANDIAWGDSLLGRLINSIIRKAKVGVNLVRIDSVIKRLKEQFDYLITYSEMESNELTDDVKIQIDMLLISIEIGLLKEAIEKSDEEGELLKKEIIIQTKNTIYNIKQIELQTTKSEVNKKEVLEKLELFLSDLEDMNNTQSTESEVEVIKKDNSLNLYMNNLKSMVSVLNAYQKLKDSNIPDKKEVEIKEPNKHIGANVEVSDKSLVTESQDQPSLALKATKSLFDYVKNSPDNITELTKLIDSYDSMSDEQKQKLEKGKFASIKRLYSLIKGDKSKVNENLDDLLSRGEELAKKMKYLYNSSNDLSGISDTNLTNSISSYRKTLSDILNQSTLTTERIIKSYKSFTKIFESEEDSLTIDNKENVDNSSSTYDISIPWNKTFSSKFLDKWTITEELKNDLIKKVENSQSLVINGTKVNNLISGIDPIMEIVKIFNRAYKIHTTETIPGARSGGRVTNRKMAEYTYIGKGSEPRINSKGSGFEAGMGPYRNNVLFNKWESAVMDILSDSKYQVLFNKSTMIKIGDADARDGRVLLQFINSLNDGDSLYKSGAQSKFINKYFGLEVSDDKLGYSKNEILKNSENADISKDKLICEFKKAESISYDGRTIYSIKNQKGITFYIILLDSDDRNIYLKYSQSFFHIKSYLKGIDVKKGSVDNIELSKLPIYFASIDKSDLLEINKELILKSFKIEDFITDSKSTKSQDIKFGIISKIDALYGSDTSIYKLPKDKMTSSGHNDGTRYDEYKSIVRK